MPVMKTLTINGSTYTVTPVVPTDNVTLLASAWEDGDGKHHQVVELSGVTPHTKVDLQPTPKQLVEFHDKVLGFVAENDGGVVTVFAIGDKPTNDHTIQVTMTEVEAVGKIRGNTVGTTMPRSDLAQTDPTKADYILNRHLALGGENGEGAGITVPEWAMQPNKPTYTAQEVGAVSAERAMEMVDSHNTDLAAHPYFHDRINNLADRLDAALNGEDVEVPDGGPNANGGFVAQDEEPEDKSLLWVDTDDETDELEAFATKEYVNDAIANIDIPDVEGLATEEYVDQSVSGLVPDTRTINGFFLKSNITLNAKHVKAMPEDTPIPSIDGLASEEYVDNAVNGNKWELVERVALGYELLAEKPDDWATNYANYYWWVDAEISQCKSAEWQAGKMYKSVEYEPVLEVARTIEPNGENYNFKKIYIKSATTKAEGITGQASVNYAFNKNAILTAVHLDVKPMWGAARAQIDGGVIMLDGQAGSLSKWNGANAIYPSVYRNMLVFTDSINEVAIKSTNTSARFAKGTVFEIWGVRS